MNKIHHPQNRKERLRLKKDHSLVTKPKRDGAAHKLKQALVDKETLDELEAVRSTVPSADE